MGLYRWIKGMPNWKIATGIAVANVAILGLLASPKIIVGKDGSNDQRRYVSWPIVNSEPIRAQVWLDKDGYINTSRIYDGVNGDIVYIKTVDWEKDGNPDAMGVVVYTGERFRSKRKTLSTETFTKFEPGADFFVNSAFSGKMSAEEAYKLAPEVSRFLTEDGLDVEGLANMVTDEAYEMTEADRDPRFARPVNTKGDSFMSSGQSGETHKKDKSEHKQNGEKEK